MCIRDSVVTALTDIARAGARPPGRRDSRTCVGRVAVQRRGNVSDAKFVSASRRKPTPKCTVTRSIGRNVRCGPPSASTISHSVASSDRVSV